MAESITAYTHRFLAQRPAIRDCLIRGLINYSSLAREICNEIGKDKFDAVVAACRRFRTRSKNLQEKEKSISRLIRKARVRVRNKISVAIVDKPRDMDKVFSIQKQIRKDRGIFQFIESEEALTLIVEAHDLELIRANFAGRIKKVTNNLSQILMIFDQSIETTPGVVSHIFALLGANNINVFEELSCWTDVMFIISEKDQVFASELLANC